MSLDDIPFLGIPVKHSRNTHNIYLISSHDIRWLGIPTVRYCRHCVFLMLGIPYSYRCIVIYKKPKSLVVRAGET